MVTDAQALLDAYATQWDVVIEHIQATASGMVALGTWHGTAVALKIYLLHKPIVTGICGVTPVLESSRTSSTLRFCAPYASSSSSATMGDARGIMPEGDESAQAAVLDHYHGQGAVRVLRTDGVAMVLERAMPGTPLVQHTRAGRDDEATKIWCTVVHTLHTATGPIPDGIRPIAALEEGFARYLGSGDARIPHSEVVHAQTMYRALRMSQRSAMVRHGDLHHDNILCDQERGWLAIDPKGYWAEPEYEVGAWLRNPIDSGASWVTHAMIAERLDIIERTMGWNRTRMVQWGHAQAMLAALWCIEDGHDPEPFVHAARVMFGL